MASAGHGHHLSGIIIAGGLSTNTGACHKPPPEPAFNRTPPLLFHGNPPTCFFAPCENGNVMMTAQTGPLVVTPIFWDPTGSMSASYKSIIASFIADVAKDSGHNKNVFSVADQYFGNNGQIQYNIQVGPAITATNAMPPSGCIVAPGDTSGIYADNSGYSSCLDDSAPSTTSRPRRSAPTTARTQPAPCTRTCPQEEFSNNLFASSGGTAGCLQSA